MNTALIAVALRALADAIETPSSTAPAPAPTAPIAPMGEAANEKPKRGRPPKAAEAPTTTATTPTATSATPAVAPPAPAPTAAAPVAGLTHAVVANDFKAAAQKHGRDFVVAAMKAYDAPTFDKVPAAKLGEFQQTLKAGPQAAPAADASDLLG